ncbi:MAG: hypothetical protein ACLQDQ_19155 [Myxococcaceae bacterium]
MKSWRASLVACLVLALASGCNTLPPPMVGAPGPELPDAHANAEYQAVLQRYSVQRQIFIGFDTILFGGVTYESPLFREARIRRRDAFQAEPPEQVARDVQAAQVEPADFYEFTVGVYMQNPRFDDIGLPTSIWRLALVTPLGEVAPVLVKRLGHANINTRAYYPYMGDFWRVYTVRFPKAVAGRPLVPPELPSFTVLLASSLGQAEFPLPTQ